MKELYSDKRTKTERVLPAGCTIGQPNLILCPEDDIFSTLLSIYAEAPKQPLPTASEVLLCSSETNCDNVQEFLRRAMCSKEGCNYFNWILK